MHAAKINRQSKSAICFEQSQFRRSAHSHFRAAGQLDPSLTRMDDDLAAAGQVNTVRIVRRGNPSSIFHGNVFSGYYTRDANWKLRLRDHGQK